MFWLLLLAGVLALAVGLLVTPVHVVLSAQRDAKLITHVRITWLFFKFSPRFGGRVRKAKEKPAKPPRRRVRTGWKAFRAALSTRGLGTSTARLFRRLARAVRVRKLTADLWVGLEDPADTGRLFGMATPLVLLLNRIPRCGVMIVPDFETLGLHGQAEAALTLSPARAISGLLLFLSSPAILRMAWLMIRARWTR